eukprot:430248-Alexandrium_andersonii.AAC.1
MNPCTERNADVGSEGMYWSGRSGAYTCITDPNLDWKEYCGDPSCLEGALAWLGVLWKIKQGCWYPSNETEREA